MKPTIATPEAKKPEAKPRGTWLGWLRPVAVTLFVLFSARSAVADWNDVPTGSMKPTILEGDRIVVNKLAFDLKVPFLGWQLVQWADPLRGDVVIFASPADGTRLVKRVVGIPGDTLQLVDNRLFVNGEPAVYAPLDPAVVNQMAAADRPGHAFVSEEVAGRAHPVLLTPARPGPANFGPVTVPAGHYFMMGDNRDNSLDSRYFGFVHRAAIEGEATVVALSFRPAGFLQPRWDRFGRAMP